MTDPEIVSPEVRALEANVSLGVDVEAWLQSPIGMMVIRRCEEERSAALEALADADPEDPKAIRALQMRVRVVDTVQQYMADAIASAQSSLARLEQLEQGD